MAKKTLEDEITDNFFRFFREIKGYDSWTDEQITFSMNNDDVCEYVEYIKSILEYDREINYETNRNEVER